MKFPLMSRMAPAAALLLAAALAAPAAAQQPAPRPLSLADALRVAEENNPAYRKALAQLETAAADRRQALGAFFPSLTVGISSGGNYSRTVTAVNEFGEPVKQDPVERRSSSMNQSLSLSGLTLFDGGQRLRQYRAANAASDATTARAGAEALRMRGELARRYFRAVKARRVIALEERLLASARERVETTQRLVRVAVRTPVDVLGAEVDASRQELALERARGDARKAALDLRQEMGVIEGGELALTDEAPAPADPTAFDAEALLAVAVSQHPRIAGIEASSRAAEHRLGAARATRFPTLSMNASAGRGTFLPGYDALTELNPLNQSVNFGFSLSYPLFNGFQTGQRIAQARAGLTGAREDARAERLAVERDVRAALIDLENATRASAVAERTVKLASERLEMAQEQYRLGSIGWAELQDAADAAARAERDALSARFEAVEASVTLEEKVGAPVARR
jgi:outer membrane protein